ncbi:MAG: hypothetical protein Q9M44_00110, partial [Ghiorsea sp.]|nr:hypothetical protein [Ghiorsea sp.]
MVTPCVTPALAAVEAAAELAKLLFELSPLLFELDPPSSDASPPSLLGDSDAVGEETSPDLLTLSCSPGAKVCCEPSLPVTTTAPDSRDTLVGAGGKLSKLNCELKAMLSALFGRGVLMSYTVPRTPMTAVVVWTLNLDLRVASFFTQNLALPQNISKRAISVLPFVAY